MFESLMVECQISGEFKNTIGKKDSMIMFYAPWCSHCRDMKPDYAAVAKELKSTVPVLAVDCTVVGKLCQDENIQGYPTVNFYKAGSTTPIAYQGDRTQPSLTKFVKQQVGDGPASSSSSATESLSDWPESSQVKHIDAAELADLQSRSGPVLVMFYAPWCSHCTAMKPDYAELSNSKDSITVAAIDCVQHTNACTENDIQGYPTIQLFLGGNVVPFNGARTVTAMAEFVDHHMVKQPRKNSEKKPTKPSSSTDFQDDPRYADSTSETAPAPPSAKHNLEPGTVHDVTADQLNNWNGDDLLVMFSENFCEACAGLKDLLKQAAAASSDVRFGHVDCHDHRDLCNQMEIEEYPTFMKFQMGSEAEEYEGKQTLEGFLSAF